MNSMHSVNSIAGGLKSRLGCSLSLGRKLSLALLNIPKRAGNSLEKPLSSLQQDKMKTVSMKRACNKGCDMESENNPPARSLLK